MRNLLAVLLLAFARLSFAVFADEAGSIDYALNLLGAPSQRNTFFAQPSPNSKASLIFTLSDLSSLAAVNPKDGSLIWRHSLNATGADGAGYLSIGQGQEIVYAGVGDTVSAWSAPDGRLVWQRSFPGCSIRDVRALELVETSPLEKDVIVVLDGEQNGVHRLSSRSGSDVWKYHDTSDSLYAVSAVGAKVHVVSLRSAMLGGQKIRVAALDAMTGKLVENITPSSEDVSSPTDIVGMGVTGSVPILAWTDSSKQSLKVNVLGTKNVASFDIKSKDAVEHVSLHGSPATAAPAHFLVHLQTAKSHWAQIYGIDSKAAKISKIFDLPEAKGWGTYAASAVDSVLYFTHTTLIESKLYSSLSNKPVASLLSKQSLTPTSLDPDSNIHLLHSTSDVVRKADGSFAVRSAIYLESGHWLLFQNGQVSWSRPEMLAGLVKAEWAEMRQPDPLTEDLEAETHADGISAFVYRLTRHAQHLQVALAQASSLPQMLQDWAAAFLGIDQDPSFKDKVFGFDRQIIGATRLGDIVVIDPTSTQKVISQWKDVDYEKLGPEGWAVASVGSLNGKLAQHLRLSPTGQSDAGTASNSPRVTYSVRDGSLVGSLKDKTIWQFNPGKGYKITRITSALDNEPVASIGRVLGDRKVLYKYLNPNFILVSAVIEQSGHLTVSVLDAVSGGVLYSATHTDVDLSRPLASAVTENWFTYSFSIGSKEERKPRGQQLVMGELFESELPNDRGPLAAYSNFSSLSPALGSQSSMKPYVHTHTYVVPEEISHMAVTQTSQGITTRQLLVYLAESGSIVGIPHVALDPRRPVNRDPTKQELEEGLVRYHPFIDFDPKYHLTHKHVINGVKEILTTPSAMESTSLVFAYGALDVFGTRVTPSFSFDILSNSFNKAQLLLTVTCLTAGTFAVVPFVQRKQTNALWQV